jgi:hypothetical protein
MCEENHRWGANLVNPYRLVMFIGLFSHQTVKINNLFLTGPGFSPAGQEHRISLLLKFGAR